MSKFVFSVVCDNVTLPESIAVIYPSYHWKSSHESLGIQSRLQALYFYLWKISVIYCKSLLFRDIVQLFMLNICYLL